MKVNYMKIYEKAIYQIEQRHPTLVVRNYQPKI
jgi:hypothetical protein